MWCRAGREQFDNGEFAVEALRFRDSWGVEPKICKGRHCDFVHESVSAGRTFAGVWCGVVCGVLCGAWKRASNSLILCLLDEPSPLRQCEQRSKTGSPRPERDMDE